MVKRNAFTAVAPAIALCVLMATTNLCAADPAATPTDSTTADDNQPTMELIVQLHQNDPAPRLAPAVAAAPSVENIIPRIANAVCDIATQYLGTPYKWGGTTPKAFDCSGFVRYVYNKMGIKLPRTAREQFKKGVKVAGKALRAGDLVFFDMMKGYVSHVGMYIGGGKFIHAANPRRGVRIDRLNSPSYAKYLVGARRYAT